MVAGVLVCAVGLRQDDIPGLDGHCASWSGLNMRRLGWARGPGSLAAEIDEQFHLEHGVAVSGIGPSSPPVLYKLQPNRPM